MGIHVDPEYIEAVENARRELRALISSNMLRLAWHDAGTYGAKTKTGGPNGSIRMEEEYCHSANNGLKIAIDFCEEVKKICPKISYADLYQWLWVHRNSKVKRAQGGALLGLVTTWEAAFQLTPKDNRVACHVKTDNISLAGVVAVEVTGGPTIDFVPVRRDSSICPKEGRLPDASRGAPHLKSIFYRMGHSDKDIVALSGGHTLGRAHRQRSGYDGQWTRNPHKFDYSYFIELMSKEKNELLKLPTDMALMEDDYLY